MTAALLLVTLLLQVVADPNEPRGSISGRCLSAQTNEPLKSVSVQLSGTIHGKEINQAALSGPDGAFSFQRLPAGSYSVLAEKAGYKSGGMPDPILIETNQGRTGIEIKLSRSAAITGRVFDADGQPVVDARTTAYRLSWQLGRRNLPRVASASTDDRSVYRLYDLPAGRYIIGAVPPSEENPRGELDAGGTRAFYPSATAGSQATVLNVRWGQELTEVNITLPRLPTFSVAGVVADTEAGGPCKTCMVQIDPIDDIFAAGQRRAGVSPDGTYRARGLPPGGYRISAVKPSGRDHLVASRSVYVTDRNVSDVHLVVGAARNVNGRIVFDSPPADAPKAGGFIMFQMAQGLSGRGAPVQPDLSFQAGGLSAGIYQVRPFMLPRGSYMKAIKIAGTDLPRPEIEIPEEGTLGPLEVVVAFDSATVSGRVKPSEPEGSGHRVTAARVVLFPKENQSAFLTVRQEYTDPSGAFTINAIPPGAYTAFTFPVEGTSEWFDPEVRRQFQSYGKSIDLSPRKRETIELTLVPPPAEQ